MMRDILQSRYLRRRVAHKQLARTSLSASNIRRHINLSFVLKKGTDDEDATEFAHLACA